MIGLVAVQFVFATAYAGGTSKYKVGEKVRMSISNLRFTQLCFGEVEMLERKSKIQQRYKEDSKEDFDHYLEKKAGTAIIGPGGEFYLKDGHHRVRALTELGLKSMWVEVLADLSQPGLKVADFRNLMEMTGSVYLHDCNGSPITWEQLPKDPLDFKNDPYRSLVWLVRETKSLDKFGVSFEEYYIAELFRKHIKLADTKETTIRAAIPAAIKIITSAEAEPLLQRLSAMKRIKCEMAMLW